MKRVLILLFVALAAAAGLAAVALYLPYAGFRGETILDIPRGTDSRALARLLEREGVVRHRWQFLLARSLRSDARLHAGEYRFDRPASPWRILERLTAGDVLYYELTVPEGNNLWDIAASLDRLGIISGEAFLEAARDPSIISDLAPDALTLEGYLFPDTYRITRHTTAAELCLQMTNRFRQVWARLGASEPVHPTVTLASLIEKETGVPEERALISSVFHNRLRLGMSLDCDPTTIYAALLEDRYRGTLYRSDLLNRHPYNTYQHPGLPPGPIANPGLQSLKAALNPAASDYLYFVARPDGSGAHQFSKGLEAHQRAVREYRRGNQARQTQSP